MDLTSKGYMNFSNEILESVFQAEHRGSGLRWAGSQAWQRFCHKINLLEKSKARASDVRNDRKHVRKYKNAQNYYILKGQQVK